MLSANRDRSDHIVVVAWNYDTDWNLAIVGAVSGVEGAAAVIETDLASDIAAESGFECGEVSARRHE